VLLQVGGERPGRGAYGGGGGGLGKTARAAGVDAKLESCDVHVSE
jgi:hypothetical protein